MRLTDTVPSRSGGALGGGCGNEAESIKDGIRQIRAVQMEGWATHDSQRFGNVGWSLKDKLIRRLKEQ